MSRSSGEYSQPRSKNAGVFDVSELRRMNGRDANGNVIGKETQILHPPTSYTESLPTVSPETHLQEPEDDTLHTPDPTKKRVVMYSAQIEEATKSFRAYYGKIKAATREGYSFDHSSVIYLMDKKGAYLGHFSSSEGAAKVAEQIRIKISALAN